MKIETEKAVEAFSMFAVRIRGEVCELYCMEYKPCIIQEVINLSWMLFFLGREGFCAVWQLLFGE